MKLCTFIPNHRALERGWPGRIDGDRLAVPRAAHDHAGGLVAEHQRPAEAGVADACLGVPVQVGPAQTDRGDPDEDVPADDIRIGLVPDAHILNGMEPRDLHRSPSCSSTPGDPVTCRARTVSMVSASSAVLSSR